MACHPNLVLAAAVLICPSGAIIGPAANAQTKVDAGAEERTTKDGLAILKPADRSHPDYVRCRSEPIIGSLVRKRKICMTNSEWEVYVRAGNAGSRSLLDDVSQGGMRQE